MDQDAPTSARRKRFTMIRSFVVADWLTLGNGFCGSGAVLALMQYLVTGEDRWIVVAMALLPLALMFDFADGRVARWRRRASLLGADLDSLADVISFGLAPAALGFAIGLRGELDVAILLYFVACGISRLARFNATAVALADESGKVRYFEGTPIPTSVAIVGVIAVLFAFDCIGANLWLGLWRIGGLDLHPFALIYAVSGSAMISTIHVPKIQPPPPVLDRLRAWPEKTVFVVYCAGPHCNGAHRAAVRLARMGRPVKIMIGGITGWLDEGLPLVRDSDRVTTAEAR